MPHLGTCEQFRSAQKHFGRLSGHEAILGLDFGPGLLKHRRHLKCHHISFREGSSLPSKASSKVPILVNQAPLSLHVNMSCRQPNMTSGEDEATAAALTAISQRSLCLPISSLQLTKICASGSLALDSKKKITCCPFCIAKGSGEYLATCLKRRENHLRPSFGRFMPGLSGMATS